MIAQHSVANMEVDGPERTVGLPSFAPAKFGMLKDESPEVNEFGKVILVRRDSKYIVTRAPIMGRACGFEVDGNDTELESV